VKFYKEILIIQAILFGLFWIFNEYVAWLLTAICVPMCLAILIISLISEMIERSKISKEYFILMIGLTLIPLLLFIVMYITSEGQYAWMTV
jgi:hypothetical protein